MCARRRTHFFCFAKRSKQEKATRRLGPLRCATGQPAVLEFGGVSLNSLRSNNAIPDPPNPALLGPASTGWSRAVAALGPCQTWRCAPVLGGRAKQRPVGLQNPLRLGRGAQGAADKGWRMSERSELCQTPLEVSTAGCPKRSAGTQTSGRLLFAYFLLAKQEKVSRPPGRDPASALQRANAIN